MVLRYDPSTEYIGTGECLGNMVEDPSGDYVTYYDYLEIRDEKIDLEVKLKRLEQMVKDLYMEF